MPQRQDLPARPGPAIGEVFRYSCCYQPMRSARVAVPVRVAGVEAWWQRPAYAETSWAADRWACRFCNCKRAQHTHTHELDQGIRSGRRPHSAQQRNSAVAASTSSKEEGEWAACPALPTEPHLRRHEQTQTSTPPERVRPLHAIGLGTGSVQVWFNYPWTRSEDNDAKPSTLKK